MLQKYTSRVAYAGFEKLSGRFVREQYRALKRGMQEPWAERQIRNRQKLAALVSYSKAVVPYYRDLLGKMHFNPELILSDTRYLLDIPILTKRDIMEQGPRLIAAPYKNLAKLHTARTNGSTGANLNVYYDLGALDISAAVTKLSQEWVGFGLGDRQIHLSSRIPSHGDKRANWIESLRRLASNRDSLEIGALDSEALVGVWDQIKRQRPKIVQGLPSQMYALAKALASSGDPTQGCFEVFVSTGETLQGHQKSLIEGQFGCRVVNRYGNAEFGILAHGVADTSLTDFSDTGTAMRVFDTHVWIDGFCQPGSSEDLSLVVTGLNNRCFPLINYSTGDIGTLREGEDGLFIDTIKGRVHEVVRVGKKEITTQYIQDILSSKSNVVDFQLHVDVGGSVSRIVIACDNELEYKNAEIALRMILDERVPIDFCEYRDFVRVGTQSKFSYVVKDHAVSEDAT